MHRWEMMIPGEWEGRRQTGAVADPLPRIPQPPADSRGGNVSEPPRQRRELPGWLKVSIFAAALLAATWLVMLLESTTR